jgi:hypothetical protein
MMIPPDFFLFLQEQRHREMMRQAEQAWLVRTSRRKPGSSERVFQHFLWRVGGTLLSWGCVLQYARRATQAAEKGCCVCL